MFKLMLTNVSIIIYTSFYTEKHMENINHVETRNLGDLVKFFFIIIFFTIQK